MRKIEWLFAIVVSGIGIFFSMLSLGGKPAPLLIGLSFLFVSQIMTALNCLYAGWPGKPNSLDETKFYRLMGQVQTCQGTSIMVLTDAKEKVFCVENLDKPFPEGTEFVRTRKLSDGKWIIDYSIRPSETQPPKPEDSKET